MNNKLISIQVESRIDDEELPVRASLKVVKTSDPDYGLCEDEIRDRNEFIRSYLLKDFELLLFIPEDDSDQDFVIKNYSESAFNTWDFAAKHPRYEFSGYYYRIRQIMEKVKQLAIMYSCISHEQGRQNTKKRFKSLVDQEFRDEAATLIDTLKNHHQWVDRSKLLARLAALNANIEECAKVWNAYAYMP